MVRSLSKAVRELALPKTSIGWELESLESLATEDYLSDSDDESEDEVENMIPTSL